MKDRISKMDIEKIIQLYLYTITSDEEKKIIKERLNFYLKIVPDSSEKEALTFLINRRIQDDT